MRCGRLESVDSAGIFPAWQTGIGEWAKWIFCDGCEAAGFLNDGELHWGKEGLPLSVYKIVVK